MVSDTAGFIHTAATLTMRTRFFFLKKSCLLIKSYPEDVPLLDLKVMLIMSGWIERIILLLIWERRRVHATHTVNSNLVKSKLHRRASVTFYLTKKKQNKTEVYFKTESRGLKCVFLKSDWTFVSSVPRQPLSVAFYRTSLTADVHQQFWGFYITECYFKL